MYDLPLLRPVKVINSTVLLTSSCRGERSTAFMAGLTNGRDSGALGHFSRFPPSVRCSVFRLFSQVRLIGFPAGAPAGVPAPEPRHQAVRFGFRLFPDGAGLAGEGLLRGGGTVAFIYLSVSNFPSSSKHHAEGTGQR